MAEIYIKDYDTTVEFDDNIPMDQIQQALRKQFPAKQEAPPKQGLGAFGKLAKGTIENLPIAGAMIGGAVASPGIVTSPAGAGLGYLLGEYGKRGLLNVTGLGNEPSPTLRSVTTQDVPQAAIVGMSGPLAERAMLGAGRVVGKTTNEILGRLHGIGKGGAEEALKSGTSTGLSVNPFKSVTPFDKALRGKIAGREIVDDYVTPALSELSAQRRIAYRNDLAKLGGNQEIDITPIKQKANELLKNYVRFDKSGNPVWERTTLNKEGIDKVKEVKSLLESWGTQEGDNTVLGLDMLKRNLDDLYAPSSSARQYIASLKNEVKNTIVKNSPQYQQMTTGYEKLLSLQKEIESALVAKQSGNVSKISANRTLRKLTTALKNDREIEQELLAVIGNQTGRDISGAVAGNAMRSLTPLGLSGTGPALLGQLAFTAFNPKFWPVLAASSPRISAEFLRMYGKVLAESHGTSPLIAQIAVSKAFNDMRKRDLGEVLTNR